MPIIPIDHTADIRFKIVAKNYDELFKEATKAVMEFIAPNSCDGEQELTLKFGVKLSANNYESLLIDFLNEILYYVEVYFCVICRIDIIYLSDKRIEAEMYGYEYSKEFEEHIKAVTYESVSIEEVNGEIEVEITFDI